MKIDLDALRKTHVSGWKPRMDVSIRVSVLEAMIDELATYRAAEAAQAKRLKVVDAFLFRDDSDE